jgi:WD40 repeat protein
MPRCGRLLLAWLVWITGGPGLLLATPITALIFSPDGSTLLSNGARCLVLRSPHDAAPRRQIPTGLATITSLAFASEALLAASGGIPGEEGSVELRSWPGLELLRRIPAGVDLAMDVVASPDGRRLAIAGADQIIRIIPCAAGDGSNEVPAELKGHTGPVLGVAFSPQGNFLVSVSADRSVKTWDVATRQLLRTFTHHTDIVHAVAVRPAADASDHTRWICVTGGDDRTLRVWQPEIGRMMRIVRQHHGPILALAFSLDGAEIFSAGTEGIIRRVDAGSDRILEEISAGSDWLYSVAVHPNGRLLASGDWAGNVRVHSLEARK